VWTAQATFLQLPETKSRELRKGHFTCFDFQKTFHSRDVFCTLIRLLVRLDSRLLCARLAVHYYAFYSVLVSLSKSQQQQQRRVQWLCKRLLVTSSSSQMKKKVSILHFYFHQM